MRIRQMVLTDIALIQLISQIIQIKKWIINRSDFNIKMSNKPLKPSLKKIDSFVYDHNFILGKGSFGNVYKGCNFQTRQKVAVKVINRKFLLLSSYLDNIKKQIKTLKSISHPNILKYYNIFQTENNIYIITEYCQQSLHQYLERFKHKVDEEQVLRIFAQIVQGIKYLHNNNIVHRDIKPQNILVKSGLWKIIDFGYSSYLKQNQSLSQCIGSTLYMCPQLLWNIKYTNKCDIWALGITFYEMLFRKIPWEAYTKDQLLYKILLEEIKLPSLQIYQLRNLLKQCLEIREEKRIDVIKLSRKLKNLEKERFLRKSITFLKQAETSFYQNYSILQQSKLITILQENERCLKKSDKLNNRYGVCKQKTKQQQQRLILKQHKFSVNKQNLI